MNCTAIKLIQYFCLKSNVSTCNYQYLVCKILFLKLPSPPFLHLSLSLGLINQYNYHDSIYAKCINRYKYWVWKGCLYQDKPSLVRSIDHELWLTLAGIATNNYKWLLNCHFAFSDPWVSSFRRMKLISWMNYLNK